MWRHRISIAFALLVGALVVVYLGDYGALQLRVHNDSAFGTIVVRRFYAVPQKSGKIEFLYAEPQSQTCTHSLFPHFGDVPCWYLARHTEQRIDL